MRTDALIAMLARGPVGADSGRTTRLLSAATAAGLVVAALVVGFGFGPRPDLASAATLPLFWLKLALPSLLAATAFVAVAHLARPGGSARTATAVGAGLVALLWLVAALDLVATPAAVRSASIAGTTAVFCVASIALLSLPLFTTSFIALRGLAPTRPAQAGAAAGVLAGSVAAAVYAVHCNEMTVPFLAVWYVLGMALPAIAGAWLGPRLLRW